MDQLTLIEYHQLIVLLEDDRIALVEQSHETLSLNRSHNTDDVCTSPDLQKPIVVTFRRHKLELAGAKVFLVYHLISLFLGDRIINMLEMLDCH